MLRRLLIPGLDGQGERTARILLPRRKFRRGERDDRVSVRAVIFVAIDVHVALSSMRISKGGFALSTRFLLHTQMIDEGEDD